MSINIEKVVNFCFVSRIYVSFFSPNFPILICVQIPNGRLYASLYRNTTYDLCFEITSKEEVLDLFSMDHFSKKV